MKMIKQKKMLHIDVTFKNNISFRSCISKTNNAFIGNAEDLDIFIPMYNLLEYSDNYSMTSGSLWNDIEMKLMVLMIMLHNAAQGKSIEYKTKIRGTTLEQLPRPPQLPQPLPNSQRLPLPSQPRVPTLNVEVTIPLKHLSDF